MDAIANKTGFDDLLDWMINGARPSANAREIVLGICERLVSLDVPVDRFVLFIYTLHPNLEGRRFRWIPGEGVDMFEATVGTFTTELYTSNPLPHVLESQRAMRRHLEDPECPDDYTIVGELREQGFTDYFVQPLIFTTGEAHACSWSSKRKGGFSDDDLRVLERVNPPLARLTETYMVRLNAATLLSTYVGHDSGHRILEGQVHRGDGEEITAVILFVDIKNFTQMSNSLPGSELVRLLNDTFDRLVPHVTKGGGEVLKFLGDGFFAIFPYDDEAAIPSIATAAIGAIKAGERDLMKSESSKRAEFRTALHFGTFHYGNIGGADRLDFTAIGVPVNYTARLLSAASQMDIDHVISEELARLTDGDCRLAGAHDLKGFGNEPIWTFGRQSSSIN